MERVRESAEVDSWVLFGGSWGSTLAVAYAQEHPDRVVALILRGIFMARSQELRWLYERDGAAMLYPEAFQRYLNGLPVELRGSESLMNAYHTILSQEVESEDRRVAANAWSNWEHTLSSFPKPGENGDDDKPDCEDEENLAFARIECHYFVNRGFFKQDGYLVSEGQMEKIRHIKTFIVQGRWDMVCPRKTAFDLAGMFDPSCVETLIVDEAGHSTFEPGIEEALLNASDKFGKEFGWMVGSRAKG